MPTAGADARIHAFMVTYHRVEPTIAAIAALLAQTRPPDTILVVNNGTADEGAAIAAAHPGATVVDAGENGGPAGGWAIGVRNALDMATDADWLLFADDEAPPPTDDTVARLFAFATEQAAQDSRVAGVGIVGGGFDRRTGAPIRLTDDEITDAVDVDTIGGGHWPLLRVSAVRSVELPDATLFFGFEEMDFFLKIREAGFRLVVDGAAWRALRHVYGRTQRTVGDSRSTPLAPWRAYYSTRNQILLAHRFGSRGARWRAGALGLARVARAITHRDRAAAIAHLRGVGDGLLDRRGRRWMPPS